MVLSGWESESVSERWTARIVQAMQDRGVAEAEIADARYVIKALSGLAASLLAKDPVLKLPQGDAQLALDNDKADEVMDLFLRSVNQINKTLREACSDDQARYRTLEEAAWETFNMSKLIVLMRYQPTGALAPMQSLLDSEESLRLLMRRCVKEILPRHLGATSASPSSRP